MKPSLASINPLTSPRIGHLAFIHYAILASLTVFLVSRFLGTLKQHREYSVHERERIVGRCQSLKALPSSRDSAPARLESDRFVPGTNATLLRNGKVSIPSRNLPVQGA